MKNQALFSSKDKSTKTAIAAMHGPHSVFDIGHCTVIHSGAGRVSLIDQWNAERN